MNKTTLFTTLFSALLAIALGAGIAFANAKNSADRLNPCVGIVSVDFGADGTFEVVDEIPIADCGSSSHDALSMMDAR